LAAWFSSSVSSSTLYFGSASFSVPLSHSLRELTASSSSFNYCSLTA
jgi:hypothetical protein